jgi:flagellin-like protein
MQLKQLLGDDDAVSPVIGVILMVAITVILAAVIGTFVLGLGDQVSDSAPQASFNFDFEGQDVASVTHDGGDAISDSNLEVLVGGNTAYDGEQTSNPFSDVDCNGNTAGFSGTSTDNWGTDVTAGSTITLDGDGANSADCNGEDIRVVFSSSSSGETATLAQAEWSS